MGLIKHKRLNKAVLFIWLSFYYGAFSFLLLFVVCNIIIDFIFTGGINLSGDSLYYFSIVSCIVGIACGARIVVLMMIDEWETKKSNAKNDQVR
ncbi:hypothetical protein KEM66_06460 [Cronobacter sakazakii]|uniref:hypothetical protein n=1 Tax=Cronobacter sakazakii TaxID=28141 RepID=UPI000D7088E3|nr:hypothetical protein [Cronobacter sakazakii]MBR9956917.1 hypothetical protein [Cronobacter sakazakii]PWV34123.1 hypothetical protein C5955_02475 [Cronobacter sakazakii]